MIMVNEKLKYFEHHNPEFFKNVSEVVVDELGIISEKTRGPQLEITIMGLLEFLQTCGSCSNYSFGNSRTITQSYEWVLIGN